MSSAENHRPSAGHVVVLAHLQQQPGELLEPVHPLARGERRGRPGSPSRDRHRCRRPGGTGRPRRRRATGRRARRPRVPEVRRADEGPEPDPRGDEGGGRQASASSRTTASRGDRPRRGGRRSRRGRSPAPRPSATAARPRTRAAPGESPVRTAPCHATRMPRLSWTARARRRGLRRVGLGPGRRDVDQDRRVRRRPPAEYLPLADMVFVTGPSCRAAHLVDEIVDVARDGSAVAGPGGTSPTRPARSLSRPALVRRGAALEARMDVLDCPSGRACPTSPCRRTSRGAGDRRGDGRDSLTVSDEASGTLRRRNAWPGPLARSGAASWTTPSAGWCRYVDGQPAGTGGWTLAGPVCRLWGGATHTDFRGRGAYRAALADPAGDRPLGRGDARSDARRRRHLLPDPHPPRLRALRRGAHPQPRRPMSAPPSPADPARPRLLRWGDRGRRRDAAVLRPAGRPAAAGVRVRPALRPRRRHAAARSVGGDPRRRRRPDLARATSRRPGPGSTQVVLEPDVELTEVVRTRAAAAASTPDPGPARGRRVRYAGARRRQRRPGRGRRLRAGPHPCGAHDGGLPHRRAPGPAPGRRPAAQRRRRAAAPVPRAGARDPARRRGMRTGWSSRRPRCCGDDGSATPWWSRAPPPLNVAAVRRGVARMPFPAGVRYGRELDRFVSGARPLTEDDARAVARTPGPGGLEPALTGRVSPRW